MLAIVWAAPAFAAGDPRFAVDRFEPSERGSEWFANESLGFAGPKVGPLLLDAGVVSSVAYRPFVLDDTRGNVVHSPVRDLWVLHAGADAVLFDWIRVGVDLPLEMFIAGKSGARFGAAAHDQGIGDLRMSADVRLGKDRSPFRVALGAQLWAPTGSQAQWTSDGTARFRPRVMLAGDISPFVWSGQVGYVFRGGFVGNEISASAAAGVRVANQIVLGPEAYMSAGDHEHSSIPVEAMLGAHWLIAHTIRIGGAVGHGFTSEPGDPEYRIIGSLEYAPEFGPPPPVPPPLVPPPPKPSVIVRDDDHDGVPDDVDACRGIAGIPTADPATNGCPPDTDGDGIDDLNDACPLAHGVRNDDPALNGCPVTP